MRPIGGSTEIYNKQPQALLILDNLNVSLLSLVTFKSKIYSHLEPMARKVIKKMENSQDITPFFKKHYELLVFLLISQN